MSDNSLKNHFKFLETQFKKWPDWKKKALLTRIENSKKKFNRGKL